MDFLKSFKLLSLFFVLAVLASCSSSDGGNSSNATTGRVSLLITDGVTDDFDQVNLTVESISFLSEDDGHETTVFDEAQVINLLALQNYSDLLVTTMLPVGVYDKIRLHVSKVELVEFIEGEEPKIYPVKLPANGKVDLNPQESFVVEGNGHLMVELDIDAEKAIHIVEKGNKIEYNFRPVVFVNILGEEELKLVLLDGKVLAKTDNGFQLCEIEAVEVNDGCSAVSISGDTVVQDDLIAVVAASSIENNDIVTVLGLGKAGSENIGALHVVIAADESEPQNLALFTGNATSVVDINSMFGMATDDDNVLVPPLTSLDVTLADGARIFDKHGTVVGTDVIGDGTDVDVFGLAQPDLTDVTDVRAAFVIYDNHVMNVKIAGTIIGDIVDNIITVNTGDEITTTFECVDVAAAKIMHLSIEDGILSEITVSELQNGMDVTAYGVNDGSACLVADFVLATDLLAIPL